MVETASDSTATSVYRTARFIKRAAWNDCDFDINTWATDAGNGLMQINANRVSEYLELERSAFLSQNEMTEVFKQNSTKEIPKKSYVFTITD